MKKTLFPFFLLISISQLEAQNGLSVEIQQLFYRAYTTNSIPLWESGIQQLQQKYEQSKAPLLLLEIARAEGGLVSACLGNEDLEKAEKVANAADAHLLEVLKNFEDNADANALYGGILGLQIGFSPIKGMWLGPKSNKYISRALKLEDSNPVAWYQKASSYYHTPSKFGGNVKKSIESHNKAIHIYEQSGKPLEYNWEYLNTLVWLGQAYLRNEQQEEAVATFKKCLKIAPDFAWVRYRLLPLAEKS